MNLRETKFALFHRLGKLPVRLSDSTLHPVIWTKVNSEGDVLKPKVMKVGVGKKG